MYTELLTKIRNAQQAEKKVLKTSYSKMDFEVAEVLAKNNFIASVSKKGRLPKRIIEIELKYNGEKGAIEGVKFLSKPSRRMYSGYEDLYPIKQGYGVAFISTPEGIMTTMKAKKKKVGGQLLFEIW